MIEMNYLLELIQVALGNRLELSGIPNDYEWTSLYKEAQKQTVLGIIMDGLEKLPKVQFPNKNILFEWIGRSQLIEQQNELHISVLKKINKCLCEVGIPVVFMKGLICGSRYPNPKHRQCGDIDFVVANEDLPQTLALLEKIGKVNWNLIHEHHGMAVVDGVIIEPHYKVHNYQCKGHDNVMQRKFDIFFPNRLEYIDIEGESVPVFPKAFEGVFLVSHMVNHIFEEGLGLRQVIDYSLFLQKEFKFFDRKEYENFLRQMGMVRAHRIFVGICEEYLGLPTDICGYHYTMKEKVFVSKLMQDILHVGNFGCGEYVFRHDNLLDELKNYLWVSKRSLKFCYICPSEAFMWPISKLGRYVGKKLKFSKYISDRNRSIKKHI